MQTKIYFGFKKDEELPIPNLSIIEALCVFFYDGKHYVMF